MDLQLWPCCSVTLTLIVIFNVYHVQGNVQSDLFKLREVCGVSQKLQNGCLTLASSATITRVQCASMCQRNSTACLGILMNETGNCYLYHGCGALDNSTTCTGEDALYSGYERFIAENFTNPCQNGGSWQEDTQTCACVPYYSGNLCDVKPTSCSDLRNMSVPDGTHVVNMTVLGDSKVSTVRCDIGANFVHTYLYQSNGSSNYNSTFQEYKDGFYRGDTEFWLGLDNLHRLTSSGVDTLVATLVISGVPVVKYYYDLEVKDESNGYEIDFSTYNHVSNSLGLSMGRCLSYGRKFSTWDHDQDQLFSQNIAALTGSGWWFDLLDSWFCNLSGKKPSSATSTGHEYLRGDFIDFSFDAYGQDFESSIWYLEQTYP